MAEATIGFADIEIDPAALSDDELALALRRCGLLEGRVAAAQARLVAEITRRRSIADAEAALRREQRLGARQAKKAAAVADIADRHAEVADALRRGAITPEHALALGGAADEHPDHDAIADLLPAASTQSADHFARTARGWRQRRSADGGESEAARQRRCRKAATWVRDEDGMGILHAEMDPVSHARATAVLRVWNERRWRAEHGADAVVPPLEISTTQRLHDALIDALDASLAGAPRPITTQLVVIADHDVVSGHLVNGRLADGTPLPEATLRRLACDAEVLPMLFSGAGVPLWAGRSRRLPTRTQRLAVIARDRGCVGETCQVPPEWCDLHHITHWEHGGPTDVDNLCLVCSRCHAGIHDGTLEVVARDGRFVVTSLSPRRGRAGGRTRPERGGGRVTRPAPAHGGSPAPRARRSRGGVGSTRATRSAAAPSARSRPTTGDRWRAEPSSTVTPRGEPDLHDRSRTGPSSSGAGAPAGNGRASPASPPVAAGTTGGARASPASGHDPGTDGEAAMPHDPAPPTRTGASDDPAG